MPPPPPELLPPPEVLAGGLELLVGIEAGIVPTGGLLCGGVLAGVSADRPSCSSLRRSAACCAAWIAASCCRGLLSCGCPAGVISLLTLCFVLRLLSRRLLPPWLLCAGLCATSCCMRNTRERTSRNWSQLTSFTIAWRGNDSSSSRAA